MVFGNPFHATCRQVLSISMKLFLWRSCGRTRLSVNNRTNWTGTSRTISAERLRKGVNHVVFDTGRHRRTPIKTNEPMAILHSFDQRGIPVDSHTYVKILQRFCKMKDLAVGKQVHDHIIRRGLERNPYVVKNLIQMYFKCGSLVDACQLFDKLLKKDVVTWTMMIGGYVQHGHGAEAFEVFRQMQREGVEPDRVTYMSILNACANPVALGWGKEVHAHINKAGLEPDVRVGNALVNMYAKCGSIGDARQVFDKMVKRDVISWNVMIGAYAESGHGDEAFEVLLQMQREGPEPDAITYLSILNACTGLGGLELVKEVHSQALKAGVQSDVRVGNALVNMYAKNGSLECARQVFDKMIVRDIISWNVMIGSYAESGHGEAAFEVFQQMRQAGLKPNAFTFLSILKLRASPGALEWVKKVHVQALKAGFESDVHVGGSLVNMYAMSGSIEDARQLFDKMARPNIYTWNVLIRAYAESGRGDEAFQVLLQMRQEGLEPNPNTYLNILKPCASAALGWVKEVHAHALETGFESHLQVGGALVNMYVKNGSIADAHQVFDKMVKRDVITWTVMIGAYADSGRGYNAFELFLQMCQDGPEPDAITYLSVLNPRSSPGALEWVKKVHAQALKAGFESDVRVDNALVNMYAKSGSIEDAREHFDKMVRRDVISWTIMIGGLAQHGCGQEALQLFERMKREDFRPDALTFVAVFSACNHAGLVDECRHHFSSMSQHYGVVPTIEHYGCMVDLLGRAGHLEEAVNVIKKMPLRADAKIWGTLLGACRIHENVKLAEHAAQQCLKLNPGNAGVYVLLSNIYAAAGKWDNVALVRNMMKERGVRKEPGRSWIEVDKKVHSFVVGDRSHPQAEEIYAELKTLTKKMKRAGYFPDTQFVMHDVDEEQTEDALCPHSEKLAIVYGLINTPPGTAVRIFKNLRVCFDCHTATKFISKVAGREIVARDANRFHHFKDGVCSCGDYW